jgi:folylpolyglutamate synthase/dihydropteroate synthase
LVIGVAKDKELDEMVAVIPADLMVIRCGYASPRARGDHDWQTTVRPVTSWPWAAQIAAALAMIPADVDVCVTGSFYLAGETLALTRS